EGALRGVEALVERVAARGDDHAERRDDRDARRAIDEGHPRAGHLRHRARLRPEDLLARAREEAGREGGTAVQDPGRRLDHVLGERLPAPRRVAVPWVVTEGRPRVERERMVAARRLETADPREETLHRVAVSGEVVVLHVGDGEEEV